MALFYRFGDISEKNDSRTVIEVEVAGSHQADPQRSLPAPPDHSLPDESGLQEPETWETDESVFNPERALETENPPENPEPQVVEQEIASWQGPEDFEEKAEEKVEQQQQAAGPDQKAAYLDSIRAAIERNKQYPPIARRRRLEGRVSVSFEISGKGEVFNVSIAGSSGFSVLDEAAVAAVRDAGSFGPPPEQAGSTPLKIQIPIAFELKR
ncbi:MAG: TonB family protein [Desulfosalsimonas sp.]